MQQILILTSSGGYGHITAAAALEKAFAQHGLASRRVIALQEIAGACDMISTLSGGFFNAEGLYNALLKRRHYRAINAIVSLGLRYYAWRKPLLDELCMAYIQKEKPTVVVSVAPIINGSIARACALLNIPFYVAPTDLDITLFIDTIAPEHSHTTTVLLPFKSDALERQLPAHIARSINGPIVRPEFFAHESSIDAKRKLNLPLEKPTIVAMMGGQGAASLSSIVRALCTIARPCTIVTINAPGNIASTHTTIPPHITIREYGFRTDMADFMRAADVLITKGGSMTVLEALVLATPLVLDGTRGMLRWEAFNYSFITENGYGLSAHSSHAIRECVEQILTTIQAPRQELALLHIDGANELARRIAGEVLLHNKSSERFFKPLLK